MKIFHWLDKNRHTKRGKLLNQLLPVSICIFLFIAFIALSIYFIQSLINPWSTDKIQIIIQPFDVLVGFFLYFVTAVDYALIVGRMQINNPGSYPRVIMNVFTCVGCFVGVSAVLFLWGFAKEIAPLIILLLFFAGSVMVKLGYEGIDYYEHSKQIPFFIRKITVTVLKVLHAFTAMFTFWIPELGSPNVKKMSARTLAQWSFFLPFIIGTDDLVGYMGAMTIYNVFSLLIGIYFADILIDILIFVSPQRTKKWVENAVLSLVAGYAFLYLAWKSFSEAFIRLHEAFHLSPQIILIMTVFVLIISFSFWKSLHNKRAIENA